MNYLHSSLIVEPVCKKVPSPSDCHIEQAGSTHEKSWDNYVLNHPKGIGYQLFGWKKAMESAYNLKTKYLIARSDKKIVGVLPLASIGNFVSGYCMVSLPYCDVAGPLADNENIQKKLLDYAIKLNTKMDIRAIDPFGNIDPERIVHKKKVRMIMDIPRCPDELMLSLKSKVRSQVKKAKKNGLMVQMGSGDLVDDFYKIFCENMRDLGSVPHSFSWFANLIKFMGNNLKICVVYTADQLPVAAGLIICHPKIVSVPWASSLRRYNKTNANMLLYWTLLEFTATNQYPAFDFGRSTREEGTFRFKKQWGATPYPLYWAYFKKNTLVHLEKDSNNLRKTAKKILSKIPVSTSKALGNVARKYISL